MELLLEEALQALQPDEQAGIVARFFEGKSFQEIAEMFAITEEAARKRERAARGHPAARWGRLARPHGRSGPPRLHPA